MDLRIGTWVVVADGRKGLILRKVGDATASSLKLVEQVDADPVPRTAEMGTDRPGRVSDRASGRHATVEQTDWHDRAEKEHAREVAAAVERHRQADEIGRLVVVAPPRTLAVLRDSFSRALKEAIVDEVAKDLTKHPIHEIERLLTA
ncbi:MAG: host attachment protein [Alphaproteobacteria bacterium]|nr:host attachment protein [Alphaproteobacteria bacterium]